MEGAGDFVVALHDRDMATLQRATARYRTLGLEASLNVPSGETGQAIIWHVDPRIRAACTYQLEISKYRRPAGQLWWVVDVSRSNGLSITMRPLGQASSSVLLFAITKVEQSISDGRALDANHPVRRNVLTPSDLAKLDKLAAALSAPIGYRKFKASESRVRTAPSESKEPAKPALAERWRTS